MAQGSAANAATNLDTLVNDIYSLFGSGREPDEARLEELGKAMALHVADAFKKREPDGRLRGSNMGTQCDRQMYYRVHEPEYAEDMPPHTKLKMLYGHLIEELVIYLIEETKDHTVELRQHEVELEGVRGHIDAIVDGTLVDVKSANTRSMEKFKKNELKENDPFGYLEQLNFYLEGLKNEDALRNKEEIAFLAVDQELGHIVLDRYRGNSSENTQANLRAKLKIANDPGAVPNRGYMPQPDGKSGNMALCTQCKYCSWKRRCWPTLRVFAYSGGPKFLTHVMREPDVKEITGEFR
jgi:hypothetical protein